MGGHVVLLGDSVFDNAAYIGGGPDVVRQLRAKLPNGWRAALAAVDGATIASVPRQLQNVPRDASHLVVSAGGNDALGASGVLEERAGAISDALLRLGGIAGEFESAYRAMLDEILRLGLPTLLCTIYYPRFPDPRMQTAGVAGLAFFNDSILREAFLRGLPVIDLRLVFNDDADYANPIEPSTIGGDKLAAAIAEVVTTHEFGSRHSAVFVG